MTSRLQQAIRHRQGFSGQEITVAERDSVDFIIDGYSLVSRLDAARRWGNDHMSCFVKGFANENALAAARLLMEEAPDSPTGRVILYVCAECGDIGCGAYTVRVSRREEFWTWSDFAWENGYEEPELLELPAFEFGDSNYRAEIVKAGAV